MPAIELRGYQRSAVDAVLANMERGVQAQILSAPTGSGKTIMGFELMRGALRRGEKAEFVCDRQNLVRQTSQRLTEEGVQHGVLMGGESVGVRADIRVASAQTIQARGMRAGNSLVILDECHELREGLIKQILNSDTRLIGLSATPFPSRLGKWYAEMVNTTTTIELIRDGVLCPFDIVAPEAEVDTEGLKVQSTGDWKPSDVSERVLRIVGDAVTEWEKQIAERYNGIPQPTVVFGATIGDAEALAMQFQRKGYDFRVVSSLESDEDNAETLRRFGEGEFVGIVNCAMLARGWDCPNVRILMDCYPLRKSLLALIQRYGRIMRTAPGKESALLVDMAGNWLGFRDAVVRFYTQGPPPLGDEWAQKATRQPRERAQPVCKQCRQVFAQADKVCGNCGAERPQRPRGVQTVKVVDGVLAMVDSITGDVAEYDSVDLWRQVCAIALDGVGSMDDLQRAKKRALATFRGMTGKWPPNSEFKVAQKVNPKVRKLAAQNFRSWLRSQGKGSKV